MDNQYEIDGFDQLPVSGAAPQPQPEEAAREEALQEAEEQMEAHAEESEQAEALEASAPEMKKKPGKWGKRILATALAVALVATGCGITALVMSGFLKAQQKDYEKKLDNLEAAMEKLEETVKDNSFTGNGNSISGSPNASPDGLTEAQVYARNYKSVVAISCIIQQDQYGQTVQGASSGSGFVISPDGYIITNHHVIDDATSVTVVLYDDTQYPAEVIGSDETNDVALLKINATDLHAVTIGSSDDLIVGDHVVAIGNALGELTASLTAGVISGKDRTVTTDGTVIDMLQTDAAINSGNSGGPLFNMKGEVVGITTSKYTGTSSSGAIIEGICFAVPVDDIKDAIDQIRDKGYVSTAYLGVMVMNVSNDVGDTMLQVVSVENGGAAHRAGLRAQDYIFALGDYEVNSLATLTRALRQFEPGDTTTITVLRGYKMIELEITLQEKPAQNSEETPENMPTEGSTESSGSWWDDIFG